jgi:hypothetical protein
MVKTMEESHEAQLPVTSAPAAPPAPLLQPDHASIAPPAKRPGRWLRFRRTLRLLFRRWLYAMTLVFRWMRPYAVFVGIVAVLVGIIAWMGVQLWWPSANTTQDVRVAALPPPQAVQTYIQGQQTFNADLMWDSLSTTSQVDRLQNGISKATMQAQANSERTGGLQYRHYDYIGGVKLTDGGSMYIYAVDVQLPQGSLKLPFTFIADTDGKVKRLIIPQ